MDHFFQTLPGWFDDRDKEIYDAVVNKFQDGATFVEVGSYKGRSACAMAVNIINSNKNIKFYCVDTWKGSPEHQKGQPYEDIDVINGVLYDVFLKNIQPVKNFITPIKEESVEAAKHFNDNSLDFVFLDADHSYEAVTKDLYTWFYKIKNGGVLSGHDWQWSSVQRAVIDFATNFRLEVQNNSTIWFINKG